jgi:SAM-dependent methyltransferase
VQYAEWKREEEAPFQGWDFSYIKHRIVWDEPPWGYAALARELVEKSRSVLDIATGGGEVFSTLAPFPRPAVAIEGWRPNAAVAKERLFPLGASVVETNDTDQYPFKGGTFELVLNRHGGLHLEEISRVLRPRGQFLTQQVDGRSLEDLLAFFETKPKWPENNLKAVSAKAAGHALKIKRAESWNGRMAFLDVGALVYLLTNTPWLVGGFSVDSHIKYLDALQRQVDRGRPLTYIAKGFLLWCEK